MVFHICRTNPNTKRRIAYTEDEIDFFFLYCIENKWCGFINITDARSEYLTIHLDFPKNTNQAEVKIADDYQFDHKIQELLYDIELPKKKRPIKEPKKQEIINEIPGRVTREQLKREIREFPFLKVAKVHNVSDNAIRKWCKRMGLPSLATDIKRYSDEEWENI